MDKTTDLISAVLGVYLKPKLGKLIDSWGEKKVLIYDGFIGSGSTLIACQKTNRICYGMEIDPYYCDVIIQRYITKHPKLEASKDYLFGSISEKFKALLNAIHYISKIVLY